MRYFYIFILTLILISCNEKKGYSYVIEYGESKEITNESECRNVVEKGKMISNNKRLTRFLYKGFIYWVLIYDDSLECYYKRKF